MHSNVNLRTSYILQLKCEHCGVSSSVLRSCVAYYGLCTLYIYVVHCIIYMCCVLACFMRMCHVSLWCLCPTVCLNTV